MVDLPADVEQHIVNMTDGEWAAFTARYRAPDSTEALRSAAAKHIDGDRLDSFVRFADVSKFVGADGKVDEAKISRFMAAAYGAQSAGAETPQYGQHSQNPPGSQAGDAGKIAAAKRFGTDLDPEVAARTALSASSTRGANGRAAAAKRFPQKGDQQ